MLVSGFDKKGFNELKDKLYQFIELEDLLKRDYSIVRTRLSPRMNMLGSFQSAQ